MKNTIQTQAAPQAIGPYSQAVSFGDLLFVSGQLGIDITGNPAGSDIHSQTRQALKNIQSILKAAGLGMDQVLKSTIFLTNLANFNIVNQIYGEYFQAPFPARACVQVAKLPKEALIEIEVIAGK